MITGTNMCVFNKISFTDQVYTVCSRGSLDDCPLKHGIYLVKQVCIFQEVTQLWGMNCYRARRALFSQVLVPSVGQEGKWRCVPECRKWGKLEPFSQGLLTLFCCWSHTPKLTESTVGLILQTQSSTWNIQGKKRVLIVAGLLWPREGTCSMETALLCWVLGLKWNSPIIPPLEDTVLFAFDHKSQFWIFCKTCITRFFFFWYFCSLIFRC